MVPHKNIDRNPPYHCACLNQPHLKAKFKLPYCVLYLLMRAARWLLVLVSMGLELSELRVASGLATGAVDFPLASPVQRSMNCNVGP